QTPTSPGRRARSRPPRSYGRRQLLAGDLIDDFAVRPAFEFRHDLPHHLAQVLGSARDRLADRGADVFRRRLRRQELLDNLDLRGFLGLEVLAPTLGVPLDRLAP